MCGVLVRLGIETRLQLAITICIIALVIATTLGGSGSATWVFILYRTLLPAITVLSVIGCWNQDTRLCRVYLACTSVLFGLMLVSVLRIQGSHFDGFYLWFKYVFFAAAFLPLAHYTRYQSARWKALLLGMVVGIAIVYLVPDLLWKHDQVAGFSRTNANYFGTYLLIGLAGTTAGAIFGTSTPWRIIAGAAAVLIGLGVIKTGSRGATVAMAAMIVLIAIRTRDRIPRQVWLAFALVTLLAAVISSPFLIGKFVDRGNVDPYNYARTEIWRTSLRVIGQSPVLGVGLGQFIHVSKRFTLPVEGPVARYLKRAQMAHNEYLQQMAEIGIPSAILLFSLLGYLVYLAWKRSTTVSPEFRCFHEAALLTATGVGAHALVDNCWTIPVTAASLVVLSLADILPLQSRERLRRFKIPQVAFAGALVMGVYVYATLIPALALYYNDVGHQAYDRNEFETAKNAHLRAIAIVPNHPVFLDNLGMVYMQWYAEKGDPQLLESSRQYFAQAIDANRQSLDPYIHMEGALLRSLSGSRMRDRNLFEEIVRVDTELLTVDPYIPFARKNLASAYHNLGKPEEAIRQLQTAIAYEPNYVPGHLQIAAWYAEEGDTAADQRSTTMALNIINKYRDFKPAEHYEILLLGRPDPAFTAQAEQKAVE